MKQVFKYFLPLGGECTLQLPRGAQVLSAKEQNGQLCLWALVDPSETIMYDRFFSVLGTGIPHFNTMVDFHHIDTIMMMGGQLVLHVFELRGKSEL